MRYAIAMREDEHSPVYYWTTRAGGDTDNYSPNLEDAATFPTYSHAKSLMLTLGLDEHHFVVYG